MFEYWKTLLLDTKYFFILSFLPVPLTRILHHKPFQLHFLFIRNTVCTSDIFEKFY